MEHNAQPGVAYEPPAVVYESALEVRAGTPIPQNLSDVMEAIAGD